MALSWAAEGVGQGPEALENETPGAQGAYKQRRPVCTGWPIGKKEVMADADIQAVGLEEVFWLRAGG